MGTSAQSVAERVQRPIERRLCRRYIEQAVRDGDLDEELLATETNGYSPATSSGNMEVNGGSPDAAE